MSQPLFDERRIEAARRQVESADALLKIGDQPSLRKAWRLAARASRLLRQAHSSDKALIDACTTLGVATWYLAGPAKALGYFREAAELVEACSAGQSRQCADVWDHLALALHSVGRLDEAISYQKRALALCGDDEVKAQRLKRRLANSLQDSGYFVSAQRLMAEIRPGFDEGPAERLAWFNAAAMLSEQTEDFSKAMSYYDHALDAFDEIPVAEQGKFTALLSNSALLCVDLGRIDEAAELFEKQKLLVERGAPLSARLGLCRVAGRLAEVSGDIEGAVSKWESAEQLLERSAEGDDVKLCEIVSQKAGLQWKSGKRREAIETLERLLERTSEYGLRTHEIEPAIQLARLTLDDGRQPSRDQLCAAFVAEAGRRRLETEWKLFAVMADLADLEGQRDAAILLGKLAVGTIGKSIAALHGRPAERHAVVEARLQPFESLTERLIASGRLPEAAHIQSLHKIERLFHFAARDTRVVQRSHDVPMRTDEKELAEHFEDMSKKLRGGRDAVVLQASSDRASFDIAQHELEARTLFERVLKYSCPKGDARVVLSVDSLSTDPTTAVIRYVMTPASIAAEILKCGLRYQFDVDLAPDKLSHLIHEYRSLLMRRENSLALAQDLYNALIRPAVDYLDGQKRLEFDVSGALSYLPFAALHDGDKFLIEHYSIVMRTAAAQATGDATDRRSWTVTAFGAVEAVGGYAPLTFVSSELAAIKDHWPAATVLADQDFTHEVLRATLTKPPCLVHIACHYHLQLAASHHSYFVLGDGSHFPVAAFSHSDLDLSNIQLMVLSGCDTATFEQGNGGAESLAALLQSCGVREVIAALWPVPDLGAAALFSEFYSRLSIAPDNVSAPKCLREAQLALLTRPPGQGSRQSASKKSSIEFPDTDLSHPYFWAGLCVFVPGGDTGLSTQQSATEQIDYP